MTNCVRLFGHWFYLVLQLSLKGPAFPGNASHGDKCWVLTLHLACTHRFHFQNTAHISKPSLHDTNISDIIGLSLAPLMSPEREYGPIWTSEEIRNQEVAELGNWKKFSIPVGHKIQAYEQSWIQTVRLWCSSVTVVLQRAFQNGQSNYFWSVNAVTIHYSHAFTLSHINPCS